jgi:RimJ/RimL family protein N-acetyltransferase
MSRVCFGFIDLFDVDFTHLKASVGIIVDHKFLRTGLAEAALHELAKFALEQKIHTLWAKCQTWNEASVNLFRKSGFQIVEEQDQFITLRLLL